MRAIPQCVDGRSLEAALIHPLSWGSSPNWALLRALDWASNLRVRGPPFFRAFQIVPEVEKIFHSRSK